MYVICVVLCLFSALSRRVGALEISLSIVNNKAVTEQNKTNICNEKADHFAEKGRRVVTLNNDAFCLNCRA